MRGKIMVEKHSNKLRLRFFLPASVLSWSLAMWISGPKLLIHSGFTYILALLFMVVSWGIIPLAVIYDTNLKENIKKQDIILKVMYVVAAFLLLYTEKLWFVYFCGM